MAAKGYFSQGVSSVSRILSLLKQVDCKGYNVAISLNANNQDFYETAYKIFGQLYAIEYFKFYCDEERKLYGNKENLHIYHGKNCEIMEQLLPSIKGRAIFFLNMDDKEPYLHTRKGDEPYFVEEAKCINQFFDNEAILFISSYSGSSKHDIINIFGDRFIIAHLVEDIFHNDVLVIKVKKRVKRKRTA